MTLPSTLFNRVYKVKVGDPGKDGIEFSNLHIDFTIKKTKKTDPNTLSLNIKGLSEDSRNKITKDSVIEFSAGYSGNMIQVFFGEVDSVVTTRTGGSISTRVIAKDGWVPLREGFTNRVFPENTSVQSIIEKISRDDLKLGDVTFNNGTLGKEAGLNKVYEAGRTFSGSSKTILEDICRENKLEAHIQSGSVTVQAIDEATKEKAIVISSTTGLVGSVESTYSPSTTVAKAKKSDNGIKFTTLLMPQAKPGIPVKIESSISNLVGTYTIDTVNHTGAYEGSKWNTTIEALGRNVEES